MALKTSTAGDGNVVILEPKGSLIGGTETDELKEAVNAQLAKGNTKLIIDMANTTYLNSSAIGVLAVAHNSYKTKGGKMILCNVNKSISNIFLVTKLSTLFLSEDKLEDAVFAAGK